MAKTEQPNDLQHQPQSDLVVEGSAPTQSPDWDGLAASFQAEAARPGHVPAPVGGLDVEQTARVLTVVAGQWGRYAPPAAPSLPALVHAPLSRLPWVPLAHRALEREAFAVLPRAWRPVLAEHLLDTFGFHPHPDAWLPHAEDADLHPDLWPFAGPKPQEVDSAVFASWTTDAMMAALERWDVQDKAAADVLRLAVWEEAGARLKARLLDISLDPVDVWFDDVRALALDATTGVELRRAARRALSRWGMWEAGWPLTEEEQEAVDACAAGAPGTGLMARLLGRAKSKSKAPATSALEPQRVPYAVLGLSTMEMPTSLPWSESDWWNLLIASAPRALWGACAPKARTQAAALAAAGVLRGVPSSQRAEIWADVCTQADPLHMLSVMNRPCAGLPLWHREEWDSMWNAWRRYGTPASAALSSLFVSSNAFASWRALPPDWAPVTQHRNAAVINLLSTLQGETR